MWLVLTNETLASKMQNGGLVSACIRDLVLLMCDLGCSLQEPSFCESTGGGHMKNNKSPDWRLPLSIHSIHHWPVVGVTHLGRRTPSSRWPAAAANTWNLNGMPPPKPCPNYRIKQVSNCWFNSLCLRSELLFKNALLKQGIKDSDI